MKAPSRRIVAREFLLVLGVAVLALLCAVVLWSRNGILVWQAKAAEAKLQVVNDTISRHEQLNRYYVMIVDPLGQHHPGLTRRSPVWSGLTGMGYHLGSFSAFCDSLHDTAYYRSLYERVTKDGYDVGRYKAFAATLGVQLQPRRTLAAIADSIASEKAKSKSTWKPPADATLVEDEWRPPATDEVELDPQPQGKRVYKKGDVIEDPFAEFGGQLVTPFTPAPNPDSPQALEWNRRVYEIAALDAKRNELSAAIAGKRAAVMSPRQIWTLTGWVALALVTLAYPVRLLFLMTRWSIRTLTTQKPTP